MLFREEELATVSIKADFIPYLLVKKYEKDAKLHEFFNRLSLQEVDTFNIYGYKATNDVETLIAKCNTIGSYLETNKSILEMKKPLLPIFAQQTKYPGTKVNVIKSRVDDSSKIGESDLSIVKSSIEKDCNVSKSVKIEESVVMDGVTIESGLVYICFYHIILVAISKDALWVEVLKLVKAANCRTVLSSRSLL